MKWRWLLLIALLSTILLAGGFYAVHAVLPNIVWQEDKALFVKDDWSSDDLKDELITKGVFHRTVLFDQWWDLMSMDASRVKPGRYFLDNDMTTYDVLNKLRLGEQTPLMLNIERHDNLAEIASYLGNNLMHDSAHFMTHFEQNKTDTSLCAIIPNSYSFYWTADAEGFISRMEKVHAKFWATYDGTVSGWPMTPCEVYILASIVERESQYSPERPRIAGVYVNRLKQGTPLQADPTVIFALNDPTIRRVLYRHLETPSPYNTYLNAGLPPGPICMPSLDALNAVRQAEDHEYIYFCAKADNSGTHAFAKTLAQHNRNARSFQRWMNERGIRG